VALNRLAEEDPTFKIKSDARDTYAKRLSAWADFEEIELKPEMVSDKSESTRARIQAKESAVFQSRLPEPVRLVLLDERGKSLPTSGWAGLLRSWEASSVPVVFGIAGSLGFAEDLRKKASLVISLGPQTLSHELARVVLLEQLYRALSVLRGHPYHNAD
jgi:23S rRNA (pseudouridine1915-N3)-methyltransferase